MDWWRREGAMAIVLTIGAGLFVEGFFDDGSGFNWPAFLVGAAIVWVAALLFTDRPRKPPKKDWLYGDYK